MPDPNHERHRQLVQAMLESGQITAARAQELLAETVQGMPSPQAGALAPQLGTPLPQPRHLHRTGVSGSDMRPLSESGEWLPRAKVGAYLLEDRLGRGGAGEVWRATHLPTGAPRALKTLLPFAEHEDRVRFLREAQALATLDGHPHVVRVHEVGEFGQRAYLVMDLARPDDLSQRLKAGPLPADEARELLEALALGLAHVHRHGLLHRDLKPHNVLFADDGRPLLSDFGLVRGPNRSSLSVTGEIMGTPAYMAPEQAIGDPVDERTDVYGLGAVLYHVLAGRPPFGGRSPIAVLRQVIEETPAPPSKFAEGIPRDLERVCLRALAKDPNQRYPSARALLEALHTPPPARAWLWPAVGLIVLGLGLAGGALARTLAKGGPPPPDAEGPVAVPLPAVGLGTSSGGPPVAAADPLEPFLASLDMEKAKREAKQVFKDLPHLGFMLDSVDQNPDKYESTANHLQQNGASARCVSTFYYASAKYAPDSWVPFARFVKATPRTDLDLPDGVLPTTLALSMLERGVEAESKDSMSALGELLHAAHWGVEFDSDRALELYLQAAPEPTDRRKHESQLIGTVELVLHPPVPFEKPPPLEFLLERVEQALTNWRAEGDGSRERQQGLCDSRYGLERAIGSAGIEALEALEPEENDWAEIEANPKYLESMQILPRNQSLHRTGQELSRTAKEDERAARQAALCFLEAVELGLVEAWNDLSDLIGHKANPLGMPWRSRHCFALEALWRAAEEGNSHAIGDLGHTYWKRGLKHEAEFARLRTLLMTVESIDLRPMYESHQRLKFALAVGGYRADGAATFGSLFPIDDVFMCLEQAIAEREAERQAKGKHVALDEARAVLARLEQLVAEGKIAPDPK